MYVYNFYWNIIYVCCTLGWLLFLASYTMHQFPLCALAISSTLHKCYDNGLWYFFILHEICKFFLCICFYLSYWNCKKVIIKWYILVSCIGGSFWVIRRNLVALDWLEEVTAQIIAVKHVLYVFIITNYTQYMQ